MEPDAIRELLAQLDALGYFSLDDEEGRAWAEEEAVRTGVWYNDGSSRVTWGDAEAIAEWGACDFLARISPLLQRLGVPPPGCEQPTIPDEPSSYSITVNGKLYPIFSIDEDGAFRNATWLEAPARTFAIVEELLREAGVREHIYTAKGEIAQSHTALFLTEEMYHLVNNHPAVPDEQKLLTVEDVLGMLV
jgi:hypothetical protein